MNPETYTVNHEGHEEKLKIKEVRRQEEMPKLS
jgi:hypothetical protein